MKHVVVTTETAAQRARKTRNTEKGQMGFVFQSASLQIVNPRGTDLVDQEVEIEDRDEIPIARNNPPKRNEESVRNDDENGRLETVNVKSVVMAELNQQDNLPQGNLEGQMPTLMLSTNWMSPVCMVSEEVSILVLETRQT